MSEKLQSAIDRLGLSIRSKFIPFSQSRNAKPNPRLSDRSLNWEVTLVRDGHDILTTFYSVGIAHCPSYKQHRMTVLEAEKVVFETEQGRRALGDGHAIYGQKRIEPSAADVIYSLVLECDVLNSNTFEEWAVDFGYDPDSRKGEAIYRACLEIALKIRNGLGEAALEELSQAALDY